MSIEPKTAQIRFLQALMQIISGRVSHSDLNANLRSAIIDFASETPDNLNCLNHIEVAAVDSTSPSIKIIDKSIRLSDIAHALEDAALPPSLKTALPNLTQKEWEAFARITTLIYASLETNTEL